LVGGVQLINALMVWEPTGRTAQRDEPAKHDTTAVYNLAKTIFIATMIISPPTMINFQATMTILHAIMKF
jgi:hypothetical protein